MVLLLPLLLLLQPSTASGEVQRVHGKMANGSCWCPVDTGAWSFPSARYESVKEQVQTCEASLTQLDKQVQLSSRRLPEIQAMLQNITAALEPHRYLADRGLYANLYLRRLGQELQQVETKVAEIHLQLNNPKTTALSKELVKLRQDIGRIQMADSINMKTVREKLRQLKNSAESCRSIPKDFTTNHMYCLKGLLANISEPVVTKISPFGKTYISGSWGKQAESEDEEPKGYFWVQPLINSHIWGHVLRLYAGYEDFMAAANHKDHTMAPSYSHANAVEGPSGVLHGDGFYYHCRQAAAVCRYDLNDSTVARATLPSAGVNNKFPYCYYDCRANSDVDLEADETGLWAIYATAENHGNLVVSRLTWDGEARALNVTQTWETRIFKKAVSNAFMACGVLYATRYAGDNAEEVFYAFDTSSGKEDNTLQLPLEKVAKGVASLSYNPREKRIYMYNDGYLLAYEAHF